MRILAVLANVAWLVFIVVTMLKDRPSGSDVWGLLAAISTLLLNIVLLTLRSTTPNWLSLFLQRRALEEQQKISALKENKKPSGARGD